MRILKSILYGLLASINWQCCTEALAAEPKYTFEDLLKAISWVESGHNPDAFNEKEGARGVFQIRPIYVKDVNRILGYQKYSINDCWDYEKSREMVGVYLRHYGRGKSLEEMAAVHNSGPKGGKYLKTNKQVQAYVQKVKEAMENG